MAKRIAGITIELDGDTSQLDKALRNVDKTSRDLQSELKAVEKGLQFDPGNSELIRQKQEILAESIENTAKKLAILRKAQDQVEKKFASGEISAEQYRAFRRELDKTESQLEGLQKKASSTDAKVTVTTDTSSIDKAEGKLDGLKRAAKDAGKEIGDALSKGGSVAFGAGSAAVVGMTDFNNDLARLRTNAKDSATDFAIVEQAFKDIVAITNESDAAVETISNLLASGIEESKLESIIDGISGATIRFSDTLKSEGIADGIQETFATNKAIGPFAELLERSGVNLEEFDKKLALTKDTSEKTDLVLQTFAETGLFQVNEEYRKSNEALVQNNESMLGFQTALADLAIALTPVITFLTEVITKMAEWAAANPELTQILFVLAGVITVITGALLVLAPIFTAIAAIATAVGVPFLALIGIIAAVIAIIVAVIAAGVALYKNWDVIGAKVVEFYGKIFTAFVQIRRVMVEKIAEAISFAINKFRELKDGASQKLAEVLGKVSSVWNDVLKFLGGINLYSIGRNIISGMMRGISSMATSLVNTAKGVVNGAIEGAKNLLGIKSPSRVFMEIGKYTGEGMAIGMERSAKLVDDASKVMASASIPDISGSGSNSVSSTQSSLIQGNNFYIREEADITKTARELLRLQQQHARGSFG